MLSKVHLKTSIKLPVIRFIILDKVSTKLHKTEVNTLGRKRKACRDFYSLKPEGENPLGSFRLR